MTTLRTSSLATALLLAACGAETPRATPPASPPAPLPAADAKAADSPAEPETFVLDRRFEPALLEAAAEYSQWGYVDERPNRAPTLCRMPTESDYGMPARARLSAAGPHGEKLYYLAAKDKSAYLRVAAAPSAVGQIVVKEAWTAEDAPPEPPRANANAKIAIGLERLPSVRHVDIDGRRLHAGTKAGLYIMVKLDPETPGTDQGWIYGTVTADGATVTAAGRVSQCMGCHEAAPHGRLFGLQRGGAQTDDEILEQRKHGNPLL